MHSEQIDEITGALAKAQGAMAPAGKDAINSHLNSGYASLASIWEACRKPLAENGLAVVQTVEKLDNTPTLVTTLAHESGQFFKSYFNIQLQDGNRAVNPTQQFGSAMTYARRYALAAIVGISVADDDGNASQNQARSASEPNQTQPQRPPPQQTTPQQDRPKDAMTTYWLEVKARGLKDSGIGAEILAKANNNPVTAIDMLEEVPR